MRDYDTPDEYLFRFYTPAEGKPSDLGMEVYKKLDGNHPLDKLSHVISIGDINIKGKEKSNEDLVAKITEAIKKLDK